jgi:DNA-binding GntR family transcriptional regulator
VVYCDDIQAELLEVPVGSAAILLRSVLTDVSGAPIETAHVLYRADRFRFRIDRPRIRG